MQEKRDNPRSNLKEKEKGIKIQKKKTETGLRGAKTLSTRRFNVLM